MTTTITKHEALLNQARTIKAILREDAAERDRLQLNPTKQIKLLKNSGLLTISIPESYGGQGASWHTVLHIVRELASVDSAIAHLYGFHIQNVNSLDVKANAEQKTRYYAKTQNEKLFWANAVNTKEKKLFGRIDGQQYVLDGIKTFASGSPFSDALIIAWRDDEEALTYGLVDATSPGLTIHNDWDGFGQRQTGSGTVTFEQVRIPVVDALLNKNFGVEPLIISRLTALIILANVFIGSAQGALEEMKQYVTQKLEQSETELDPLHARRIGELVIAFEGANALVEQATIHFSQAWQQQFNDTPEVIDAIARSIIAANTLASEIALKIANDIFDVMGARAATIQNGFDRYWRNIRTHTLHDAIDNKKVKSGAAFIYGQLPV